MTVRRRHALAASLLLWLGGLAALPARPAEMLVEGEVVRVEPLEDPVRMERNLCQPPRPGGDAGLVELLAWDLRAHCSPAASAPRQAAGYRVYYRWDGRTYSRVMNRPPGDTITLRVRLH